MKKTFIAWAKEKYSGTTTPAANLLAKLNSFGKDLKASSNEAEFAKMLKLEKATDAELSTLHSMFQIYKDEVK